MVAKIVDAWKKRFKAIMDTLPNRKFITDKTIHWILSHHPRYSTRIKYSKLITKSGHLMICEFKKKKGGKRFEYVDRISWNKAILYMLNRKTSDTKKCILSDQLRSLVYDQIIDFRLNVPNGFEPGYEVHHDGMPFCDIKDNWVCEVGEDLVLSTFDRDKNMYNLSRELEQHWWEYHQKYATLRLLTVAEHREITYKKK